MTRLLTIGYGAVCYVVFLAAFVYSIGFVGGFVVPRTVDHGVDASIAEAVIVNVLLLGLFAVQHSAMARPAFKRWWTRFWRGAEFPTPTSNSANRCCTASCVIR